MILTVPNVFLAIIGIFVPFLKYPEERNYVLDTKVKFTLLPAIPHPLLIIPL